MNRHPNTALVRGLNRPKRVLVSAGVILFALISFAAWALSSPVGATPDEDFHLASIWCGAGEREGLCAPGSTPERREIPDKIEQSACYAHHPEMSADCQGDTFADRGYTLKDSRRVNSTGQYPSGYYFWSSLFASDNLVVSTLTLRFAQALFFTTLAVVLWGLLPRKNRPSLLGGIAVTFVPLGMFLIPSVTPSGWSIASGALLLPALVGYLNSSGWKTFALGAFSVLAALLGLAARSDSAAYTIVAVLAALILTFETSSRYWWRTILPTVIVVAAAVSFLTAGQTGLALNGMTQNGFESLDTRALILENFWALPELFTGVLGQNFDGSNFTGLGWLDTPLPAAVWAPTTIVFAAVIFAALRQAGWRRIIALTGVAVATFTIPFYILYQSHVLVGYQVQPRYIMPLLTMFVACALTPVATRHTIPDAVRVPHLTTVQLSIIAALLSLAHAVALLSNLRRYVSPNNMLFHDAEWWWRATPPPMMVWCVGAAAFAALATLLVLVARNNRLSVEVNS